MKIKAIITGATGMVGEGVMHECLNHSAVEKVLIINRRPSGFRHEKLEEIVHSNFYDFSSIKERLNGYNACYFCLGTSSIGMSEPDYSRVTHDLTLHVATTLLENNPDMTFCYVSGAGTDSSEKGRSMWARVKGKTENDLMKLPFKKVYAFRPGFMQPTPGLKNTLRFYKYIQWLYPILRKPLSNYMCSLKELGVAMINVTLQPTAKDIMEVKDIVAAASLQIR